MNRQTSAVKKWLPVMGVSAVVLALVRFTPAAEGVFARTVADYTIELVTVLPAVMILMGLMTVFVSNDMISRLLGGSAGLRGVVLAFVLGTLPTGPLYVAFPFARSLRDKGASVMNITIFLSAWACIKLPQELVELRFLGWQFMVTRLVLTVLFVTAMGAMIGWIERRQNVETRDVGQL
ncbi:MAG: permease [Alkalispirochaeta sp.]